MNDTPRTEAARCHISLDRDGSIYIWHSPEGQYVHAGVCAILERENTALRQRIADDNRAYGCELRDPSGTIWEHAAKLEKEVVRLQEACQGMSASCAQSDGHIERIERENAELTAMRKPAAQWSREDLCEMLTRTQEERDAANQILGKLQTLHGCTQEMVVHWCEHAVKRAAGADAEREEVRKIKSYREEDRRAFNALQDDRNQWQQRAEVELLKKAGADYCMEIDRVMKERDALRRKAEPAEADSKRYAFLCETAPNCLCFMGNDYRNKEELDAAIDAALAAGGAK
jgi:uncharacterized coiled-coil DUF342 family protein